MHAPEPVPAPAETIVETFPRRLAAQGRLEGDDRGAMVAQEIFAPAEERPGLVVRAS
jgi:hypothetical protein